MPDHRTATIREIDALVEALETAPTVSDEPPLMSWLAKIRAHAEADELERKRLQGESMLSARAPVRGRIPGEALFDEDDARRILGLKADWRMAPQRARAKAHAMPPAREVERG